MGVLPEAVTVTVTLVGVSRRWCRCLCASGVTADAAAVCRSAGAAVLIVGARAVGATAGFDAGFVAGLAAADLWELRGANSC